MCADKTACVRDPHCIQQYLYLVPFTQNNRIFLGSQIARFLSFRAASPPSCLWLWGEEISLISHFTCHPVWGSVSLITSCPWASMQLCPCPNLIAFPLPSPCTLYFTFAWTWKLEAIGGFGWLLIVVDGMLLDEKMKLLTLTFNILHFVWVWWKKRTLFLAL